MTRVLDLVVKRETIDKDIRSVVHQLIPEWPEHRIRSVELSGGYVNSMHKCWLEPEPEPKPQPKSESKPEATKSDDKASQTSDVKQAQTQPIVKSSSEAAADQTEVIVRIFGFKIEQPKDNNALKSEQKESKSTQSTDADQQPQKDNLEKKSDKSAPSVDQQVNKKLNYNAEPVDGNNNVNVDQLNIDMNNFNIEEVIFNRKFEMDAFEVASKEGLCSKVYGRFTNGFCYEFAKGDTLNSQLMVQEKFMNEFAPKLARFHLLPISKPAHCPFDTMFDKMRNTMVPMFKMFLPKVAAKLAASTNPVYQQFPKIDWIMTQATTMEEMLLAFGMGDVGLCHNDLNPKNGIWNEKTNQFTFIDFEMIFPNYLILDIALHFGSCCGHLLKNFNSEALPSDQYRYRWLQVYLRERTKLLKQTLSDQQFDQLVWLWHRRVSLAILLVLMRFTIGALVLEFEPTVFKSSDLDLEIKADKNQVALSGLEAVKAFNENKERLVQIFNTDYETKVKSEQPEAACNTAK